MKPFGEKQERSASYAYVTKPFTKILGKDLNKIKEDLKLKEAIKEAEAKKRGICLYGRTSDGLLISCSEKIEDAKAKAAVKAQIEADKKARAEKAAREKALRDGQPVPEPSSSVGPSRPAPASTSVAKKDFPETRLAIRLSSGGQQYTTTLPSDARMFTIWLSLTPFRLANISLSPS